MSDPPPPPPEPLEQLRRAYEQAVETWAGTWEQVVSTEEFAAASGRFLAQYAELQQSLRKTSQASAESLHLPTTDDLARVARLVVNVERKVDEVSEQVHALAPVLERLAALEAKVDALSGGGGS